MKSYCLSGFILLFVFTINGSALEKDWVPTGKETVDTLLEKTNAINRPSQAGVYFSTEVPATLDLAERARLGINHAICNINPEQNYEMYWTGNSKSLHPKFHMFDDCQAKYMEYMVMQRLMCGSQQGLETEANMLLEMISHVGKDDLYWTPKHNGDKPWLGPPETLPRASIHGQARIMRAATIWYQYTGDNRWKELVDRMVDGIDKHLVVHKDDYAYIPLEGWFGEVDEYHRSAYTEKGWKGTTEPQSEKGGLEGSLFCHQGHFPGVLSNWYMLTGNKQALRLAGEMIRFLMKDKLWSHWKNGEYPDVYGPDHAHWFGHYHGHVNTLRSILEYGIATNDAHLKQFARDGYEWTRQAYLARIGFVGDGQGCATGRLIGLAIKLSRAGVGDYWEDVNLYVRNHGIEMQFTPDDLPYINDGPCAHVMIGGFGSDPTKTQFAGCCSPWGNLGIYYAWDGILEYSDGQAKVNLLLNRASQWLDIDSYLPYEGKVVIKNKQANEISVRIPLWADIDSVVCSVDGKKQKPEIFERYLRFEDLKKTSQIVIEFPVVEREEKYNLGNFKLPWVQFSGWPDGTIFTLHFKGNTLVEITPQPTHILGETKAEWSVSDNPTFETAVIFPSANGAPDQAFIGFGRNPMFIKRQAFFIKDDNSIMIQWDATTGHGIDTGVKAVRDGQTPQYFRITRHPDSTADYEYKNGNENDWQMLAAKQPYTGEQIESIAFQTHDQSLLIDYVSVKNSNGDTVFYDDFNGEKDSLPDKSKWDAKSLADGSTKLNGTGQLIFTPGGSAWSCAFLTPPYKETAWWLYSQRPQKYKGNCETIKVQRYVTEQKLKW